MSRLDDALKRARRGATSTESFNVPSARALEWFPADRPEATAPLPAVAMPAVEAAHELPVAIAPVATAPAPVAPPIAPAIEREVAIDLPPAPRAPRLSPTAAIAEKLVVGDAIRPVAVEQYRRVAAALHHMQRDRGVRIVMIASALPGEGKTLTATNLSLTLSESYQRRVLLMDADLRRPKVHEMFGVATKPGLNDALKAPVDEKLAVVPVSERLAVLPAGGADPDPMGSLTSERMRSVVRQAAERFDWVIIDTPPLALLPDANLLAAMVDTAVLVIGAGHTPVAAIQQAIGALGRERIMGVVLNRVGEHAIPGAYGSDHYYQYGRS